MIFARRSVRRFLDGLADSLDQTQLSSLADRLNGNNLASLDTEWEVIVLYALSRLGQIAYERNHGGKSNPDLTFCFAGQETIGFVADIRAISDRGLEQQYPVRRLSELLRKKLKALGMSGTISHAIGGAVLDKGPGKRRVELGLSPQKNISPLIAKHVTPWLKEVKNKNLAESVCNIPSVGNYTLTLTYRRDARVSTGSHLSFETAYSRTNNTLYNAMKQKAEQLRDAGFAGCKGIILCDAGCSLLRQRQVGAGAYSSRQIVEYFLRSNKSISFVVTLHVKEEQLALGRGIARSLTGALMRNPHANVPLNELLQTALCDIPAMLPTPVNNGTNSIYRIEDGKYGGRQTSFGGHEMSKSRFKMSARVLLELLSGKKSVTDFDTEHGFDQPNGPQNPFKTALQSGRLIDGLVVENELDRDDDWVTFSFAPDPDPAISPFVVRSRSES